MVLAAERNAATFDPERLKYVTRSFLALQGQGLNLVAFGAAFFLYSINDAFFRGSAISLWLVIAAGTALAAAFRYIPKYYERRFGTVESASLSNKQFVVFLSVILGLVFFGRSIGRFADSFAASASDRLHAAMSDPGHRVSFLPVLFWCSFLCLDLIGVLWRSRRTAPSRPYFSLVGTLFWVFVVFYLLYQPEPMHVFFWKVLNVGWGGLSFMAIGLYDHISLVRLLPNRAEEDGNKCQ
jgi:hypothetical protein